MSGHGSDDDDDDYDYSDEDYGTNVIDYGDYDPRRDKTYGFRSFEDYAHRRELLAELASQRKTGVFLDLVVEVEGTKFPCHRAVLASTPYFKAMLSPNFAEGNLKPVQLHGIDSIAFSKILDVLYTGEIRISEEDVEDILQAAHMLQLDKIVEYCREFIKDNICPSNCLGVMRLADIYGFSALKKTAKIPAVLDFLEVCQNEEFLSLSLEELLDLLTDKDLKVTDEDDIVRSVIRWLDHDPENRKTAVPTILNEIRLSCVRVSVLSKLESHSVIRDYPQCLAKITAAKEAHLPCKGQPSVHEVETEGGGRRRPSDELAIIVGGWKAVERHQHNEGMTEPKPLQGIICVDPDIQQYYHITNLPTPFLGYMSGTCAEGRLYVTGGCAHPLVGQGPHSAPSRQAFCYDFPSDTWMELPDMPRGRAEHQSIVVDGNLVLVGGDVEATTVLSMDCYSLEEGAWMKPPTPPTIDDSSVLTVTALRNTFVLIETTKRTLEECAERLGIRLPSRLARRSERKLCVHALDMKTEHWAKSKILLKHSFDDVQTLASPDQCKLYIFTFRWRKINVYVFDAQEEALTKVEDRDVFKGTFFRTKMDYSTYRYADGQNDIVDSIISYKFGAEATS